VIVAAQNMVFVPSSVNAPAGEAFVLYFDNRDTVPHNAKLVDSAGQTIVTGGEPFTGPSARQTDVPALAAGTYKFLCDVHPDMTGELIVAP
jgi:plastocyanin